MPKEYGTPGPRAIYPELVDSRSLSRCGIVANALWPRLIAKADDQGRLAGDAGDILGLCFPKMLGKVTLAEVEEALNQLAGERQLELYDVDGEPFIQLLAWWRWQHNQRRAYPSRHPGPTGWADVVYGFDAHPKTYREAGGFQPRIRNIPGSEPQDEPPQPQPPPPDPHPADADGGPNGSVRFPEASGTAPTRAPAIAQPRVRGARISTGPNLHGTPQPPASGGRPSRANGTSPREKEKAARRLEELEAGARRWRANQRRLAYARGAINAAELDAMNAADSPLEEISDWAEHQAALAGEAAAPSPLEEAVAR